MWYRTALLTVLLFVSIEAFADRDLYIVWLPSNAVKKAEKVYTIPLDLDGAVKKVRQRMAQDPLIRSDVLLNEDGFRIYAFYNLRQTGAWRKMYLIEEDSRVTARFF